MGMLQKTMVTETLHFQIIKLNVTYRCLQDPYSDVPMPVDVLKGTHSGVPKPTDAFKNTHSVEG